MFTLRFRLNLVITLVFVLIFAIGAVLTVDNVRDTVTEDMQANAELSANLLESTLLAAHSGRPVANPGAWYMFEERLVAILTRLREEHGLSVAFTRSAEDVLALPSPEPVPDYVPGWFAELVRPEPMQRRVPITVGGLEAGELVVSADPGKEIAEAWEEVSQTVLIIFAMAATANVLVFFLVGWSLRPLTTVANGFRELEHGDYAFRLPRVGLPELDSVVFGFNQMAGQLQASAEENRELTRQTMDIQEQERRHLARELHDEMGQSISAIKALAASISGGDVAPQAAQNAATISEISNHVYDVVRRMMSRLRPTVLDELGLVRTLEQLVDDWNEHHDDNFCRLTIRGELDSVPDQHSITVYRLVQEALTNVAKHAGTSDVEVVLEARQEPAPVLHLRVSDTGRGMAEHGPLGGLGLRGMRERVSALDGKFDRVSAEGKGVTLRIEIPI